MFLKASLFFYQIFKGFDVKNVRTRDAQWQGPGTTLNVFSFIEHFTKYNKKDCQIQAGRWDCSTSQLESSRMSIYMSKLNSRSAAK